MQSHFTSPIANQKKLLLVDPEIQQNQIFSNLQNELQKNHIPFILVINSNKARELMSCQNDSYMIIINDVHENFQKFSTQIFTNSSKNAHTYFFPKNSGNNLFQTLNSPQQVIETYNMLNSKNKKCILKNKNRIDHEIHPLPERKIRLKSIQKNVLYNSVSQRQQPFTQIYDKILLMKSSQEKNKTYNKFFTQTRKYVKNSKIIQQKNQMKMINEKKCLLIVEKSEFSEINQFVSSTMLWKKIDLAVLGIIKSQVKPFHAIITENPLQIIDYMKRTGVQIVELKKEFQKTLSSLKHQSSYPQNREVRNITNKSETIQNNLSINPKSSEIVTMINQQKQKSHQESKKEESINQSKKLKKSMKSLKKVKPHHSTKGQIGNSQQNHLKKSNFTTQKMADKNKNQQIIEEDQTKQIHWHIFPDIYNKSANKNKLRFGLKKMENFQIPKDFLGNDKNIIDNELEENHQKLGNVLQEQNIGNSNIQSMIEQQAIKINQQIMISNNEQSYNFASVQSQFSSNAQSQQLFSDAQIISNIKINTLRSLISQNKEQPEKNQIRSMITKKLHSISSLLSDKKEEQSDQVMMNKQKEELSMSITSSMKQQQEYIKEKSKRLAMQNMQSLQIRFSLPSLQTTNQKNNLPASLSSLSHKSSISHLQNSSNNMNSKKEVIIEDQNIKQNQINPQIQNSFNSQNQQNDDISQQKESSIKDQMLLENNVEKEDNKVPSDQNLPINNSNIIINQSKQSIISKNSKNSKNSKKSSVQQIPILSEKKIDETEVNFLKQENNNLIKSEKTVSQKNRNQMDVTPQRELDLKENKDKLLDEKNFNNSKKKLIKNQPAILQQIQVNNISPRHFTIKQVQKAEIKIVTNKVVLPLQINNSQKNQKDKGISHFSFKNKHSLILSNSNSFYQNQRTNFYKKNDTQSTNFPQVQKTNNFYKKNDTQSTNFPQVQKINRENSLMKEQQKAKQNSKVNHNRKKSIFNPTEYDMRINSQGIKVYTEKNANIQKMSNEGKNSKISELSVSNQIFIHSNNCSKHSPKKTPSFVIEKVVNYNSPLKQKRNKDISHSYNITVNHSKFDQQLSKSSKPQNLKIANQNKVQDLVQESQQDPSEKQKVRHQQSFMEENVKNQKVDSRQEEKKMIQSSVKEEIQKYILQNVERQQKSMQQLIVEQIQKLKRQQFQKLEVQQFNQQKQKLLQLRRLEEKISSKIDAQSLPRIPSIQQQDSNIVHPPQQQKHQQIAQSEQKISMVMCQHPQQENSMKNSIKQQKPSQLMPKCQSSLSKNQLQSSENKSLQNLFHQQSSRSENKSSSNKKSSTISKNQKYSNHNSGCSEKIIEQNLAFNEIKQNNDGSFSEQKRKDSNILQESKKDSRQEEKVSCTQEDQCKQEQVVNDQQNQVNDANGSKQEDVNINLEQKQNSLQHISAIKDSQPQFTQLLNRTSNKQPELPNQQAPNPQTNCQIDEQKNNDPQFSDSLTPVVIYLQKQFIQDKLKQQIEDKFPNTYEIRIFDKFSSLKLQQNSGVQFVILHPQGDIEEGQVTDTNTMYVMIGDGPRGGAGIGKFSSKSQLFCYL